MKFILTSLIVFTFANVYAIAQSAEPNLTPSQDPVCPENVKKVRLLMASTYNTCDAIDHVLNMERINERREYMQPDRSSPNRLGRTCQYSDGQNCADISDYDLDIRSHLYNFLVNKCEGIGNECMIEGELRTCPTFYYMGITPQLAVPHPYDGDKESIDPAGSNYRSMDINGNEFVGWDCSRYLATAMRLAGFNFICGNSDIDIFDSDGGLMTAKSRWTVKRMSEATDHDSDCSCMDTVDLSNPDERIKPGDILLYRTHAMMIETSATDFMGEFTDPTFSSQNFSNQNCIADESDCVNEIGEVCSEDNIEPSDFKFSINHSDDVLGGIGPAIMNYADYRGSIMGIGESSNWRREKMHISRLCKARLCKKYNLMDSEVCIDANESANEPQNDDRNRFFKIIRHNSLKESCVDQNPPRLQNSCGETCNARVEQKSCLYSGG